MSREWLTLLIRRMDAVASIYRLASSLSPGSDGLRTLVEFHRKGRLDATFTLHDGRDFDMAGVWLSAECRSTTVSEPWPSTATLPAAWHHAGAAFVTSRWR